MTHVFQRYNGCTWTNHPSEVYAKLKNLAALTSNITRKSPHIEKTFARAHVEIIDVMLEADEEKSERLMREHLRETCRHIVEGFYPGMFGGLFTGEAKRTAR